MVASRGARSDTSSVTNMFVANKFAHAHAEGLGSDGFDSWMRPLSRPRRAPGRGRACG